MQGDNGVEESTDHTAGRAAGRVLRLALAMRGGVSLAVWIGGAVAEIDLLRRAHSAGPDDPDRVRRQEVYRRMLTAAGYDGVEVDILAGASAGGLNAVIYGLAQSVGRTTEWAEGVWCQVGSIWDLLRRTPLQGSGPWPRRLRVPSLLRGDSYFYVRLRDELLEIGRQSPPVAAADHVSIDLSATLADAPPRPAEPADQPAGARVVRVPRPAERSAVHFRFRRRPTDPTSCFTDLPGEKDLALLAERRPGADPDGDKAPRREVGLQVDRLAYAGRATSSFPGAFEPATVGTATDGSRPAVPPGEAVPPNMWGVFSETGPQPFAVVDGGLFDNVPIGRALDSIAAAPASGPTERRMIFLDPSPGPRPEPARTAAEDESADDRRRREKGDRLSVAAWIPTIARALGLKVREESSGEEIDLVRRHNQAVAQARARSEMLAAELAGCPDLRMQLELARKAYVGYRVARDVGHLAVLLTRPSATLLRASTPPVERALAMDERDALFLSGELRAVYAAQPSPPLWRDAAALVETAAMLVAWCREIEDLCRRCGVPVPDGLRAQKATLYRIRDVGRHLSDMADTALVTAVGGDLRRFREAVADVRAAQRTWSAAPLTDLHAVGDDRAFWSAMTDAFRGEPATGGVPLLESLWTQLDERRVGVVECCRAVVDDRGPGDRCWRESFFAQLHRTPVAGLAVGDLHVVLAAAGGGPGTSSVIRYHEITGDQPTPLAGLLSHVVDAERRRRVTELLRDSRLDAGREFGRAPSGGYRPLVDAGSKLAGNFLNNFSAFLARSWRVHDWRWGRLDAAAGLVDVVLTGTALDPAAMAELCRKLVCSPPEPVTPDEWRTMIGGSPDGLDEPAAWEQATDDRLRLVRTALRARLQIDVLRGAAPSCSAAGLPGLVRVVDRPKAGLGELRRRYLFGLASRLLHLAYRGMWPSTWSFPTAVARLVMVAVRPALVAVPLVASPPRALLAAAGFGWLTPLLRGGGVATAAPSPRAVLVGAVVLMATATFTGIRTWTARQRWKAVDDAARNGADPGWHVVADWRRTAGRRIGLVWAAAVAVAVWAGLLLCGVVAGTWSPSVLLLAVVALAGHAAVEWVRAAPAPRILSHWARLARGAFWLVAAVAVVVVGLAGWHFPAVAAVASWGVPAAGQVAVVAALVGALLYDGWARLPDVLVAVGLSAGAGVLFTLAPGFTPVWAAVAGVAAVAVCAAGMLHVRTIETGEEISGRYAVGSAA